MDCHETWTEVYLQDQEIATRTIFFMICQILYLTDRWTQLLSQHFTFTLTEAKVAWIGETRDAIFLWTVALPKALLFSTFNFKLRQACLIF